MSCNQWDKEGDSQANVNEAQNVVGLGQRNVTDRLFKILIRLEHHFVIDKHYEESCDRQQKIEDVQVFEVLSHVLDQFIFLYVFRLQAPFECELMILGAPKNCSIRQREVRALI